MDKKKSLVVEFVGINTVAIDKEGIYPPNAVVELTDGGLELSALAVGVEEAYQIMANVFRTKSPVGMVFGFDRKLNDKQGTTLKDGLSVTYFDGSVWKFGIMEYQHEPRIVKPIDWNNIFWMTALARELSMVLPEFKSSEEQFILPEVVKGSRSTRTNPPGHPA